MDVNSFSEALTSVYLENPCGLQANALWKTLKKIPNYRNNFEMEDTKVVKLMLWDEKELLLYWNRNSFYIDIERDRLSKFRKITLHETQLTNRINKIFPKVESYFRLIHNLKDLPEVEISKGYYFMRVNMPEEAEKVSKLICNYCDSIKPNQDEVVNWTMYPVYNKDLWLWIMNRKDNKPVGLGIAEEDNILKEASLEYILILPEYRDIGIGRGLVLELLKRSKNTVDFVTVSGRIDNPNKCENLFRKCGFLGNDKWYKIKVE